MGKINHIKALTQLLKITKLPNLLKLTLISSASFTLEPSDYFGVEVFHEAINTFLEKHGQQLTEFGYHYIHPSVAINSFKYLCNVEILLLEFDHDLPHHIYNNINGT